MQSILMKETILWLFQALLKRKYGLQNHHLEQKVKNTKENILFILQKLINVHKEKQKKLMFSECLYIW